MSYYGRGGRSNSRGRGRGNNYGGRQGSGYDNRNDAREQDQMGQRPFPYRGRGDSRGGYASHGGHGQAAPLILQYSDGINPTPDGDIHRQEDNLIEHARKTQIVQAGSHPQRPTYGSNGNSTVLWTNHFEILLGNNTPSIHMYSIKFLPRQVDRAKQEGDSQQEGNAPTGRKLKRMIEQFLQDPYFDPFQKFIATDFASVLISASKLPEPLHARRMQYLREHETVPPRSAPEYDVRLMDPKVLTFPTTLQLWSVESDFRSSQADVVQAMNIILGYGPKRLDSVATQGANKHYIVNSPDAESFPLGSSVTAWRGFFVSVRLATSRFLYNVQVKNGAFYQAGKLATVMKDFGLDNPDRLSRFLNLLRVETSHVKDSKGNWKVSVKTICGLATRGDGARLTKRPRVHNYPAYAKDVEFWHDKDGRFISVRQWFKTAYKMDVSDELPVINVGTKANPVYLPPDVCTVLRGQPYNKTMLSGEQTEKMIRFAVRKPGENAKTIAMDSQRMLGLGDENAAMQQFGIQLSAKLVAVPARVLNAPRVQYPKLRGQDWTTVYPRDGSWNMRDVRVVSGGRVQSWIGLRIRYRSYEDTVFSGGEGLDRVIEAFAETCRRTGMDMSRPAGPCREVVVSDPPGIDEIERTLREIKEDPARPRLVLVILPTRHFTAKKADSKLYNRVKLVGDVLVGIQTICVVDNKINKTSDAQYMANVALKVNLKAGGCNQRLEQGSLGFLEQGDTMIASLDVTHPSPRSAPTAPSIASFVYSIDNQYVQFRSEVRVQDSRVEMVTDMKGVAEKGIRNWERRNRMWPKDIIVYRDGVSEGQYDAVLGQELTSLKAACREIYPRKQTDANLPRITIVIVGKRHNARFFATKDNEDVTHARTKNPKNGTVVDRGVTQGAVWEMYLQSHAAIQGTARPAHYVVIHDEVFRGRFGGGPPREPRDMADIFEKLTHNFCYLFGRATKAVSICPPAYHADLICDRARIWNSGEYEPSDDGSVVSGATQPVAHYGTVHGDLADSMWWI